MDTKKYTTKFWSMGMDAIKSLETEQGILASSKNEAYGCIFGRDSLIAALKLLRADKKNQTKFFFPLVRKILINLCQLQGHEINIESGEQPGKIIHEFRPSGHEYLTMLLNPPWYVYQDQVMRNYDSVDSTPLFLIAIYRYWQVSEDSEFLAQVMPNVEAAINWIINFGDGNNDGLIDYQLSGERKFGGLVTQDWMDSSESVFLETGGKLTYPLAPLEVQAYSWLAWVLWGEYFLRSDHSKGQNLKDRAEKLKKLVNREYPARDPAGSWYFSAKIDGSGKQLKSVRSNMGHCLWASKNELDDGEVAGIIDRESAALVVQRLLRSDMFEPDAGIRTLSSYSNKYKPNSYHNGSIWPHDNGMIIEGFEIYGFIKEADLVKTAVLSAIAHYQTPIELLVYEDGKYSDYISDAGQKACQVQAWTAATILDLTADDGRKHK